MRAHMGSDMVLFTTRYVDNIEVRSTTCLRSEAKIMTYQTINPATGLTIKTYPEVSDTDLENVLATAQACYETGWRHRSVADRA